MTVVSDAQRSDHLASANADINVELFKEYRFTRALTVREYLETLLPQETFNNAIRHQVSQAAQNEFLAGILFFTHFVYVTYTPTLDQIRAAFRQCAAIICKNNQKGIDIILPVLLASGTITFILIQVKCHSDMNHKHEKAESSITPERAGIVSKDNVFSPPFLGIHMELGDFGKDGVFDLKGGAKTFLRRKEVRFFEVSF
jgi:hypothetical protein